jgi:molybdate transport system substrate-binding protein
MTIELRLLSGGAANGIVAGLAPAFEAQMGVRVTGRFGAVGAMRQLLAAGEHCDLLILTPPLIGELTASGHAVPGSDVGIGLVRTAIAVRAGAAQPPVADADGLRQALRAADAIYLPDPRLATAGIHFAAVLADLGIAREVSARLRPFPNGQTAMAAMAEGHDRNPIGCTQVTEILNTAGVSLLAPLPKAFGLATLYTAAIAAEAHQPDLARRFIAVLAGPEAGEARRRCGFE